jgi:hypothetical protein
METKQIVLFDLVAYKVVDPHINSTNSERRALPWNYMILCKGHCSCL